MKQVLVTGGSSGIGLATAKALSGLGHRVILLCRGRAQGEVALAEVAAKGGAPPALVLGDLAQPGELGAVAEDVLALAPRLDVVVHNAGVYVPKLERLPIGAERTFVTNHLGAFALTHHLSRGLVDGGRVVIVGSRSHADAAIDPDDLQFEQRWYHGYRAYCQSKLANHLFALALTQRLPRVVTHVVHPGTVGTGFGQDDPGFFRGLFQLGKPFMLSPAQGADTVVWLASTEEDRGAPGGYFVRRRRIAPHRRALDQVMADKLWARCESMLDLPALR